ncbi:MAG: hypothetical protein WB685_02555 [Pseudolabrys sp.]
MGFSNSVRCALAVMLGLVFVGAPLRPTAAQEPYKAQIDALRKSLEKYKDYKVAVRDLYLSTVGCVHYAGEKMAHYMEYPKGAMGVHFINVTVRGAPDPMKPNVLIYEPVGKELKLVAVEWLVPLTPDTKKRPSLSSVSPSWARWRDTNRSFQRSTCTMICMPGCSRITRSACSRPPTPT